MRAPISIVIPTLNAAADLPATLACLMEGLDGGLIRELVISDGGSTDDTLALAEAAGAAIVSGPSERGGQLRRGIAAARGEWLLLIHADTHLSPGWSEAATEHIAHHPDMAGYFRHAFRADGPAARWVSSYANARSRLGLPYGDQGLLVRAETLADVGGVPDLPLMEDVALARALRGRLRMLPTTAHTSARKYQAQGWLRRGARNLWTLTRYLCGVSPETLARDYARSSEN